MGLRINTNIDSIGAQRRLSDTGRALTRSYGRLSSGLRIATAADDAAGLGISERMRAQVRSMGVARRNILDGISFVQVAEGALVEVAEILGRTRELALQASNGTLTDADRIILDEERDQLALEVRRIFESTEFNGQDVFGLDTPLLGDGLEIQVGSSEGDVFRVRASGAMRVGVALPTMSVLTEGLSRRTLRVVDIATQLISETRGDLGAMQRRLESAGRSLAVQEENTAAAMSRIRDVDVAEESAQRTRLEILQQASVSVLAQANVQPMLALDLLAAPLLGPQTIGGAGAAPPPL